MSMSTRARTALAASFLTAATLAASAATSAAAAQQPIPGVGGVVAPMRRGHGERHPEIRKAIRSLERARGALQNAAQDFGGHRADALAATDNAIRQLQLALQYDK